MARKDISDILVLKAYIQKMEDYNKTDSHKWPYEYLSEWTGEPEKVCYRAMERAESKGLLEYGVSLRAGWITEKGKKLLMDNGIQIPTTEELGIQLESRTEQVSPEMKGQLHDNLLQLIEEGFLTFPIPTPVTGRFPMSLCGHIIGFYEFRKSKLVNITVSKPVVEHMEGLIEMLKAQQ